jgi:regulator of extracellular matrix RemA (YlzA/DUF370 family)
MPVAKDQREASASSAFLDAGDGRTNRAAILLDTQRHHANQWQLGAVPGA